MATKQQTVAGNNGAVATTTVAATLAATQQGSLLIAAVCAAVDVATITPPAGWIQISTRQTTNPAGGSVALFYFENNPGGITTVTFTITSSLAAVIISEYVTSVLPPTLDVSGPFKQSNQTGVVSPTLKNLSELNDIGVWACGVVANAAPGITGLFGGYTQDGVSASTAAGGNAVIYLFSNLNIGGNQTVGGCTLSALPTNGPTNIGATFYGGPLILNNGMVGPASQSIGGVI